MVQSLDIVFAAGQRVIVWDVFATVIGLVTDTYLLLAGYCEEGGLS